MTESISSGFQRPRFREGLTIKGDEGTVGGDRNVLCLDCSSGYETVYICQNLLNYVLKVGEFYCL